VASLCPTIFGNETVKAALVLGLFGGTHMPSAAAMMDGGAAAAASANAAASSDPGAAAGGGGGGGGAASLEKFKLSVRADPHVLIVGDPGLGKSQMLRAAAGVSPRGVYVSGNTASGSGLTVTMVRDPDSGDFGLEAGALVLSDQGICCIDEFDKMSKEHNALLEAMEQQRISIAKAGIVASLSARTSVLAAANPVGGHYDRSKTVVENLRMSGPLLSRFDLVFIILDKPDEERDRQLSAHVMSLHHRAATAGAASAAAALPAADRSTVGGRLPAGSQTGTRHVGASAGSGSVDSSMMRALDPANVSHTSAMGGDNLDALFASVEGAEAGQPGLASSQASASRGERNAAVARAIAKRIADADERRATQEAVQVERGLAASQARRGGASPSQAGGLAQQQNLDAMLVGGATDAMGGGLFGGASASAAASSAGMSLVLETEDIERRLRRGVQAIPDPMPPVCLRKYVAYARRYCHPVLSPAAAAVLQDFYLDLRQKHGDDDTTPITTRQLESMVRLAQARAKIDLREIVTRSDAVDVIQLMRRSLLDVAMDGMGAIDFSRSVGAGGMSMQRQVKTVIGALNKLARQRGSNRFTRDEIEKVVTELRLQVGSLTDLIETMNQQSYILKKGHRVYQLLTSDG
jgi:DNA replicative helicase MCM subunit Mcm2 (Cdc46/Mcm family)